LGTRCDIVTRDELFFVFPFFDVDVVARQLLDFIALRIILYSFSVQVGTSIEAYVQPKREAATHR